MLGGLTCRFSPPTPASSTAPLSLQRPDRAPCSASSPSTDQHFALFPAAGHCCNCLQLLQLLQPLPPACCCCYYYYYYSCFAAANERDCIVCIAIAPVFPEILAQARPRHRAVQRVLGAWCAFASQPSRRPSNKIPSRLAPRPNPTTRLPRSFSSNTNHPRTTNGYLSARHHEFLHDDRGSWMHVRPRTSSNPRSLNPKTPSPLLLLAARVRQSPTSERKSKELSPP